MNLSKLKGEKISLLDYMEAIPKIKAFIVKHDIAAVSEGKFTLSQLENLRHEAIQNLVDKAIITISDALRLSFSERNDVIKSFIENTKLSVEVAKELTLEQQFRLVNPTIQTLLEQGIIDIHTLLSLTTDQALSLQKNENILNAFEETLQHYIQTYFDSGLFAKETFSEQSFNTIKNDFINSFLQEKLQQAGLINLLKNNFINAANKITKEQILSTITFHTPEHVDEKGGYKIGPKVVLQAQAPHTTKELLADLFPSSNLREPLLKKAQDPVCVIDDKKQKFSDYPASTTKRFSL